MNKPFVYRRIIGLIDGGGRLPLMRLECGHEVRTGGIHSTRCYECAKSKNNPKLKKRRPGPRCTQTGGHILCAKAR